MALPTASTPGYDYFYTLGDTPNVACECLCEWLPLFRRVCIKRGLGDFDVWQCTGAYSASGGTHSEGGAFDIGTIDERKVMIAREMGAPATWVRNWSGNRHSHGVLTGCPHNDPAAYQILAQWLGYNGLGYLGMAGLDPHPRPSKYRTWREGIEWAKGQLGIATTTNQEDDVSAADVWNHVLEWADGRKATAGSILRSAFTNAAEAKADVEKLRSEVAALRAALPAATADAVLNATVIDREDGRTDSSLRQVVHSTFNVVSDLRGA